MYLDLFRMNFSSLSSEGWVVLPNAYENVESLAKLARGLSDYYRPATIGRNAAAHRVQAVRSDEIFWLDDSFNPAVADYLQAMEAIRVEVNRLFYLGLFDYECHFARYEPGDFYKTHVDAFADQHNPRGNRKLSSVLYLNEDWQLEDGGELVIYAPNSTVEITRVLPQMGTLVLFLSEEFPHEVLPARRERFSLTGWFRTRPNGI